MNTIQVGEYVTAEIDFNNVSGDTLNLSWDLIEKVTPTGWDYSYCDYVTCYDASYFHGTMEPITGTEHGFIKVNVLTNVAGWAYFKFAVYNVDAPAEADTIEFWFNGIVSVQQMEKKEISIYPNPTSGDKDLTIRNLPSNSTVEIYNSLGQRVFMTNSGENESLLITQDFNKGAYIVRIHANGGIETRKLIVR